MAGTHSVLSPSGASKWTRCEGSLAACKSIVEEPKIDSARGTVKHHMSEVCLNKNIDAVKFLGCILESEGFSFAVDDEFVEQVQSYVDAIHRTLGKRFVEVKLDTTAILGVLGQSGTADCVVLNRSIKQIEVHDAKFGFEMIYAKGNKQGLIYGAAALELFSIYDDFTSVKFCIHQPARKHYDEAVYTLDETRDFLDEIRPQAARAYAMYKGEIPIVLTPGDIQCKWCPIKATCKARTQSILDMFPVGFEETEPDVPMLSDEDIAEALPQVANIKAWCDDIIGEARRRMLAGREIHGQKLVQGKRGDRYWKDPEKAAGMIALIADVAPGVLYEAPKLISPTKVEKLLGKKEYTLLKKLVGQDEGGLSMVPVHDPRPEVAVSHLEFSTGESAEESLI